MSRLPETTSVATWLAEVSVEACWIALPTNLSIYRLCPVDPAQHDPMHVSPEPGRWNKAGTPMSYFADSVHVCEAELCSNGHEPPGGILEYWVPRHEVRGFDLRNLPARVLGELYSGEKEDQWQLSQTLIDHLAETGRLSDVAVIVAPSAAGVQAGLPGLCFAFWDHTPHLQLRSAIRWPPTHTVNPDVSAHQQAVVDQGAHA